MKPLEQALLDADGSYRPFLLELVENSGPVSPAYQFRTRVSVRTIEHDVLFSFRDERHFQAGIPDEKIESERSLSRAEYLDIASHLSKHNVFDLSVDRTAQKRDRVGISFNRLEVRLGRPDEPAMRQAGIDYVLSDLEDPAFEEQKRVIDYVKSLR